LHSCALLFFYFNELSNLRGCVAARTDFVRAKNDKYDRFCIQGEQGGMFESPSGTMTGPRCKRK